MNRLQRYVGRVIRVRPGVFGRLLEMAISQGRTLENRFLVAAVHYRKNKLVCYGANLCILVSPADVVLV